MSTTTISPLRQRMIEDMAARNLNRHTQRSHLSSCKRFAAWLKRSPDTATADEVRLAVEDMDARTPSVGARVVARAWVDPDFKARLLADGPA